MEKPSKIALIKPQRNGKHIDHTCSWFMFTKTSSFSSLLTLPKGGLTFLNELKKKEFQNWKLSNTKIYFNSLAKTANLVPQKPSSIS